MNRNVDAGQACSDLSRIRATDSAPAGTVVDHRYRVVDRIGGGVLSVMLRARELATDREVALRVLRHCAIELPGARDDFLAEARAMARVQHPNVVEVHAIGEWRGTPYVAMEYVRGISLDEWLALRELCPPTLSEALTLADRICLGVSAVHASGARHSDLAAGNLLVGPGLRAGVLGAPPARFYGTGG